MTDAYDALHDALSPMSERIVELKEILEIVRKYTLPRPLFKPDVDGNYKPVQFGDDIGVWENGKQAKVAAIKYHEKDSDGNPYYVMHDKNGNRIWSSACDGAEVKRPEPEVLDADGVPIHVGDTVYRTWDEEPCVVESVDVYGEPYNIECREDNTGIKFCAKPNMLTHKQPDSLQRVIEDMTEQIKEWSMDHPLFSCNSQGAEYERIRDRLCELDGRTATCFTCPLDPTKCGSDGSRERCVRAYARWLEEEE